MIRAHGGQLVNRIAEEKMKPGLIRKAGALPKITLNRRELSDLALIAIGAMSPLEGFMVRDEYESVLNAMRLPLGLPWTIPITLSTKDSAVSRTKPPFEAALCDENKNVLGIMQVDDIYKVDKEREAKKVLLTADDAHPGVQYLNSISDTYAGGKILLFERMIDEQFEKFHLDPKETRILFKTKGWERVVAFQTRNPIHRAHEYLLKCALEMVDGLLIHPIMGETKSDDIPAHVRMACYQAIMDSCFPKDRVVLSIFPAAMRYAGPREAIFHAILRKNYGCTHFIVGRDHAGVGSYYGTFDAQNIFFEFEPGELEITPMMFEHAFYCTKCETMSSPKTCPHGKEAHMQLSGTRVREMLSKGESLPPEFTRREVAEVLERYYSSSNKGQS
ncbi:MAG: sulfate adenylyltransferase [Candidatus Eisenbacteria bacterium]|nr:sulfate adenylyltransferase [Candidatus Eisenbacteria bacterium]